MQKNIAEYKHIRKFVYRALYKRTVRKTQKSKKKR